MLNKLKNFISKPTKPTKPKKPSKTKEVRHNLVDESYCGDCNYHQDLQSIIDSTPSHVSPQDINISIDYDHCWDSSSFSFYIYYTEEVANENYKKELARYKERYKKYKEKYNKWKIENAKWQEWKADQKKLHQLQKEVGKLSPDELERLLEDHKRIMS